MGCCYSLCKDDNNQQGNEVNERTHLLVDPVSNNTNVPGALSDDGANQYASSAPKKMDEQSALNRILHDTAVNIIDVGALDSHNLEQHEYLERSRAYAKRIETVGVKVPEISYCLLRDIPAPEKVLASEPITQNDKQLITNFMQKAVMALEQIKVQHQEDLVVPFLS
ncbi:ragulator complex protein LAMTOR1 [Copidosoma floridanum]|uniref:ragulator complex protein LAMTOR1 n=1 Tax=Copidosoma floridanum TaxID=29053 RepID=UPI0006C9A581|nr:ragulator complex protein LAMTOR1 [Copidosoma floridanum]